jgi:hypothetical protein
MEGMINAYEMFVRNLKGRDHLVLKQDVDWIHLAQHGVQERVLVDTVMNI